MPHDALLWNHFGSVFKACWVVSWQQSGHVPWFQLQNTENQLFNFISFWKGPYWLAGDQLCSTMKDVKDDMSRLVTSAWSGNHDSIELLIVHRFRDIPVFWCTSFIQQPCPSIPCQQPCLMTEFFFVLVKVFPQVGMRKTSFSFTHQDIWFYIVHVSIYICISHVSYHLHRWILDVVDRLPRNSQRWHRRSSFH